jgi:hypothetical protein
MPARRVESPGAKGRNVPSSLHQDSGHGSDGVKRLLGLFDGIRSHWIPEAEVRAETWALGVRHRGEVLQGARSEMRAPDVSPRRAILLKAVIRNQAH